MSRTIAIDFETYYEKHGTKNPGYSVANLGNWRYTNDPRFDAYLVSVYDGEEFWVGHPRDLNREALNGEVLLSHNAAFDSAVDARTVELGLVAPITPAAWHCTANLSSYLCNRRSLAEASEFLLKVRVAKGMRDWMNKKHWADAVAEKKDKKLMEYARKDVLHCRNLWEKYEHLWTPSERLLSGLTIQQCSRGVAIDTAKLRRYKDCVLRVLFQIENSLPWMFDVNGAIDPDAKVTSTIAIARECRKQGIPAPPVKAHEGGEEAYLAWEALYRPTYPWIVQVGQWRSINKILNTLQTIQDRLRPDGTIDFSLLYFGAHTGRFSGGGSALNLQNLRKDPLYIHDNFSVDDTGRSFTDEEIKTLRIREVIDMRSLFVPRPGSKFVICDLAQIEPRVLHWLIGDTDFMELVHKGMSPYEAAARISPSIQWKGGELKKEDKHLYQRVKVNELGLGYGCGAVKFHGLARENGLEITPAQAKAEVDQWRKSNPNICKLWWLLDEQFKESIGHDFEVGLPSGRTLRYGKVRKEMRTYKALDNKLEFKTVFTADVGGIRRILYGGLLTENLVQATARDVFAEHLLGLHRAGINTVFHVHDEAVCEVPEDADPHEVEKIMSVTPEWLAGAPIAAEANVATFYNKG